MTSIWPPHRAKYIRIHKILSAIWLNITLKSQVEFYQTGEGKSGGSCPCSTPPPPSLCTALHATGPKSANIISNCILSTVAGSSSQKLFLRPELSAKQLQYPGVLLYYTRVFWLPTPQGCVAAIPPRYKPLQTPGNYKIFTLSCCYQFFIESVERNLLVL